MNRKVLLLGATGVFGRRLAHHLTTVKTMDLIVTSRDEKKAEALAKALGRGAVGVALDTGQNLEVVLSIAKPWAVVDCSGPFQGANYDTAETIISAGVHLVDLADARDYLIGFGDALDDLAKANHVTALTGASSTPALSRAVVTQLTEGWRRVDTVELCITPAGRSEVGKSVIAAILSYAGKGVPVLRNGSITYTKGWVASRLVNLPHLGARKVSPVETADAELLRRQIPNIQNVCFSAGLESNIEQFGLQAIALLRSWRLFPNPQPLASLLCFFRKFTRIFNSDSGGMFVNATGVDGEGQTGTAQWNLIADRDHGPNVPVLAAAAALKKLLAGELAKGARLASEDLTLEIITAEMDSYAIRTETSFLPA